jgi:hypothetical protein
MQTRKVAMLNKFSVCLLIVWFTCLSVSTTIAEESEYGGAPTPDEIIGLWKMLPLADPSINVVDPWPLPYQWFAFYIDGRMASMQKNEDADLSKRELMEILSIVKESAPTYRFQDDFLIVEYPDAPGQIEIWGVNIFRKDTRVTKKGDLFMTLAGGDDGKPVYYRHLRLID